MGLFGWFWRRWCPPPPPPPRKRPSPVRNFRVKVVLSTYRIKGKEVKKMEARFFWQKSVTPTVVSQHLVVTVNGSVVVDETLGPDVLEFRVPVTFDDFVVGMHTTHDGNGLDSASVEASITVPSAPVAPEPVTGFGVEIV